MIHALALAAAVATNPTVIRSASATAPRFVRLRLDVTVYGIAGRGEILVDRGSGRFVRRFDAGPVSEREGWDGKRAWRADATGMARVQGNADERAAIVTWARLLSPDASLPPERPVRAPDVAVDNAGEVTSLVRHIGHAAEHTTFADYRVASGLSAPYTIADTSENGTWTAHVTSVESPRAARDGAFAPPADPRDYSLRALTVVPMLGKTDVPVIPVSVDGSAPLRFVLDTGGQNVITPQAARRAGLDAAGEGTVGGAGAGLASVQFASARSVRVGAAEMRDQPFLVLDLGATAPVDGIIGYELLARFGARLDMQHERVELAPDARALAPSGVAVPFVFDDRQPQLDGAIDGIPGALTLDTGSASAVDVNTPFVVAHDLRARYHADVGGYPISGVGGSVHAYFAHAKELRFGPVAVPDVDLLLTDARSGAEADASVAGNVGEQVLRRFALVLDYRRTTIHFEPPAR
ncbi:MAG TPA: pepsin/retropepsin-like aspartic protease family protein [Candidatus Elarobacter sp.]|jgi:hypothetical protein